MLEYVQVNMPIFIAFGIILLFSLINLLLIIFKKPKTAELKQELINEFTAIFFKIDDLLKTESRENRKENNDLSIAQRTELTNNFSKLSTSLETRFENFTTQLSQINRDGEERLKELKTSIEKQLGEIRADNSEKLEQMRQTVDEKLTQTLHQRLNESFKTVSEHLQSVQQGLGEMKNLASDVGGLKKVLSNVKTRGSFGELQLSMLLEQILADSQYEKNVKPKKNSNAIVEFAIKLPGKDDDNSVVWLPIDSKFPKDVYQHLQEAEDTGDADLVQKAKKELITAIKKQAKDISDKYIEPPQTTDFAIMFLPFEGLYAEVVRQSELLEVLQRDYKIIVTGPSTLAAILNSLQMGFKTLAIQKRSSEVWNVLAEVKTEFGKFGGMLEQAKKNIEKGLQDLDKVMTTRTNQIDRKLKNVSSLDLLEPKAVQESESSLTEHLQ